MDTVHYGRVALGPTFATLLLFTAPIAAQNVTAPPTGDERTNRFDLGITAGASHSDNITRVPANEVSDTIAQAGVLLGYQQTSRRIEAKVDANLAYEHYLDDTFDDDVVGGAAADIRASIIPERFLWTVQENFGQITSDPLAATTPDNRENINFFTTGPDLIFGAGGATSFRLSARYSDLRYEEQNSDSEQYGAAASLARRLSSSSTLSFNVTTDRIEFDGASQASEYDRHQVFARYDIKAARTDLAVDAGYTQLELADDKPDGMLLRLSATRRLSPASALTASVGQQFSDSGEMFRQGQSTQGVSLDPESVIGTRDPFESRFASVGFDFNRNRTSFGLSAGYSEENYETAIFLDRSVTTWGLYVGRQISPTIDVRLYGQLEQEEFDVTGFEDDEQQLGASLAWRAGRMLSVRLQYDRYDRDTADNTGEYTDNRVSLFLTWSPLGNR